MAVRSDVRFPLGGACVAGMGARRSGKEFWSSGAANVHGMNTDALCRMLPDLLRVEWQLNHSVRVAPLAGGMNAIVAQVHTPAGRYVAKWVPDIARASLEAGAEAAQLMTAGGLSAGQPLPTRTGSNTAPLQGGAVALLSWVSGAPLHGTESDQALMAATLSRAHVIGGARLHREPFFVWIDSNAPGADIEPWVKPALAAVRREFDSLPPLTWGLLHADPAPEAFHLDTATGEVGLIDWAAATHGPLLYDIASAVMYLGGRDSAGTFLRRYAETSPVPVHEQSEHLDALRRFRAGVQAAYFAGRLMHRDRTGISDDADNWKGLHDAHMMLDALDVAL